MTREQLSQIGFLRSDWVPSDTRYQHGELYVRMTERGSLRLFFPKGFGGELEISSGSLYEPVVHFSGRLKDVQALQRLLESM